MVLKVLQNKSFNVMLACASFLVSAVTFLIVIIQLIQIEGLGSPDLSFTLSGLNGRTHFTTMLFIFAIAVITNLAGLAYLYKKMKDTQPYLMLLVLILSLLAAAMFMCLLTFHYTLIALVSEGLDTSSAQFHFFSVLSHAAGDFSGWISIGLWGVTMVIIAMVLSIRSEWRAVRYTAWVFFILLVILYFLNASYVFLILFALWEMLVSVHLFQSRRIAI